MRSALHRAFLQAAGNLGKEAFEEAEVSAGDAFDRRDSLGVGRVVGVESTAQMLPGSIE